MISIFLGHSTETNNNNNNNKSVTTQRMHKGGQTDLYYFPMEF